MSIKNLPREIYSYIFNSFTHISKFSSKIEKFHIESLVNLKLTCKFFYSLLTIEKLNNMIRRYNLNYIQHFRTVNISYKPLRGFAHATILASPLHYIFNSEYNNLITCAYECVVSECGAIIPNQYGRLNKKEYYSRYEKIYVIEIIDNYKYYTKYRTVQITQDNMYIKKIRQLFPSDVKIVNYHKDKNKWIYTPFSSNNFNVYRNSINYWVDIKCL